MKKGPCFGFLEILAAGLLLSAPLAAQTQKPLIQLSSLDAEGLGAEETRLFGNLIRSYLSDFGDLTGYFDDTLQNQVRSSPRVSSRNLDRPPDYILSGRVNLERNRYRFVLEVRTTSSGEVSVLAIEGQGMGELILRARSLVESAFKGESGAAGPGEAPRLSEELAMGTWRGEPGIEMVRLYGSGRGIAFFSSGVRMNLNWIISGDTLRVEQSSPNMGRFYAAFPAAAADSLVQRAEPMRWELRPHRNRNTLRGERIFTAPSHGEGDLLYGQREEVEWFRPAP
jgi:hypothetical protein